MEQDREFGKPAGQSYNVAAAIRSFLNDIAASFKGIVPVVMKEILQNADDAGATELDVFLDERRPPETALAGTEQLVIPGLILRNNARFRLPEDVKEGEVDDFSALRDVASRSKMAQVTAAGRFGLGFNSVYSLTDTPVIFSRREIHIFDVTHSVPVFRERNGWRFDLSDYRAAAGSKAGALKTALLWMLPKIVLGGGRTLDELAADEGADYQQTVIRLPLRPQDRGTDSMMPDCFLSEAERLSLLDRAVAQTAQSMLFLKKLHRVTYSVLRDGRTVEPYAEFEISRNRSEFQDFLKALSAPDGGDPSRFKCDFPRILRATTRGDGNRKWSFWLFHAALLENAEVRDSYEELRANGEKATPWVSIAVPLDRGSLHLDGPDHPAWRVFLPLDEPGPSQCIFNGAFFVDPSRRGCEYRTDVARGPGRRKTDWNRLLVKRGLVPLMGAISERLLDLVPDLAREHPADYLSLFPRLGTPRGSSLPPLTEYFQDEFFASPWLLRVLDLWANPFEILMGPAGCSPPIEMIPEWLESYRDRFHGLSDGNRRMIRWGVGKEILARIPANSAIRVLQKTQLDVLRCVLADERQPKPTDLEKLLEGLVIGDASLVPPDLEGLWCFQKAESDELLRYRGDQAYIFSSALPKDSSLACVLGLDLGLEWIARVAPGVGLPAVHEKHRLQLPNVLPDGDKAVLAVLRTPAGLGHDRLSNRHEIAPLVKFLCGLDAGQLTRDLRLAFLVRTAPHERDRRKSGCVLLGQAAETRDDRCVADSLLYPVFPRIDPEFGEELARLLEHAPALLDSLAEPGCEVAYARAEGALERLLRALELDPRSAERLQKALNHPGGGQVRDPRAVDRALAILFEQAERAWDDLSAEDRIRFLRLPVHRFADGTYGPLLESPGEMMDLPRRVRLQSDEDVADAPVTIPNERLLQSAARSIKHFYRTKVKLRAYDRTEVLKLVLAQIGTQDAGTNEVLLRYVDKNYRETITRCDASEEDFEREDAVALRHLFDDAALVPCLDGAWRRAVECVDGREVAERLESQRWRLTELPRMVAHLLPDRAILALDPATAQRVRRLCGLPVLPVERVAEMAVGSPDPGFALGDRLRILIANWGQRPREPHRAEAIGSMTVPGVGGPVPVGQAEVVPERFAEAYPALVSCLAPLAVDRSRFAKAFAVPVELLDELLDQLGLPAASFRDLASRLVQDFPRAWSGIGEAGRSQVLKFVAAERLAVELRDQVANLAVVKVVGKSGWVTPDRVVRPGLLDGDPPLVEPSQRPEAGEPRSGLREVWEAWAGVRELRHLVHDVCSRAGAQPPGRWEIVARDIADWIERLASDGGPGLEKTREAFEGQAWVLAQRDGRREFKPANAVLACPGKEILAHRFWVPEGRLPGRVDRGPSDWGFLVEPALDESLLADLAACLEHAGGKAVGAPENVYRFVVDVLREVPDAGEKWARLSRDRAVFRAFSSPERMLNRRELYLGTEKADEDTGAAILRLAGNEKAPKWARPVYAELGIAAAPGLEHLLHALARIEGGGRDDRETRQAILKRLRELPGGETAPREDLWNCRVKTCAGAYAPVGQTYWDEEAAKSGLVAGNGAGLLVDPEDRFSKGFVAWMEGVRPDATRSLRILAGVRSTGHAEETGWLPSAWQALDPWRDWFAYLAHPDSELRANAEERGLTVPEFPISVVPVREIPVEYVLPEGSVLSFLSAWRGPRALVVAPAEILVRVSEEPTPAGPGRSWEDLDTRVATEAAFLLGAAEVPTVSEIRACIELAATTLERPSVILKHLGNPDDKHLLEQYADRVADERFAPLFDEYRRTKRGSDRHRELHSRLWRIVRDGNVEARRKEIRGYGYDEFSVFTELLQNAEDAYAQCDMLGMPRAPRAAARFAFSRSEAGCLLRCEHEGRPFNYWKHGEAEITRFRRDVDGLLRSAGSFKPVVDGSSAGVPTVGRFGLGFKSVYLVTDRPEIHSGDWHFRIEDGCRPVEVESPADLKSGWTRFDLPLRPEACELEDPEGERLVSLVPFLRQIDLLELRNSDGRVPLRLEVSVIPLLRAAGEAYADVVQVTGAGHAGEGPLRLLRVRHPAHEGQLGLYLRSDGLPAGWSEVFESDLYVVLPLKTTLGAGVGVSHHFDIQSGRTHLVGVEGNIPRFREIANLVRTLPAALRALPHTGDRSVAALDRFWSVWNWRGTDAEVIPLRDELARAVASLPTSEPVVPLAGGEGAVTLGAGPVLYFSDILQGIQDALVEENCPWIVPGSDQPVSLSALPLTTSAFVRAYSAACGVGGVPVADSLIRIDWASLAANLAQTEALAANPPLLNRIAEALHGIVEEERRRMLARILLCDCPVAFVTNGGVVGRAVPRDILDPVGNVPDWIPAARNRVLSPDYSPEAVLLLRDAGLLEAPTWRHVREWLDRDSLTPEERERLMGVLATMLGLAPGGTAAAGRRVDAGLALEALHEWWAVNAVECIADYERQTYPFGRVPALAGTDLHDPELRKAWMITFMLGALHTLGRTTSHQDRAFLELCDRRHWLEVFAAREFVAERWMEILEDYIADRVQEVQYSLWMNQFVSFYYLSRRLKEYVDAFKAVRAFRVKFDCRELTEPRAAAAFQGGGPDAPPITRVFGSGICFVLRELCRSGVLVNPLAYEHCYVPRQGVLELLGELGLDGGLVYGGASPAASGGIFRFLVDHLGEERATFGRSFDLPLLTMIGRKEDWEAIKAAATG